MEWNVTQKVKTEIDRNLSLHSELVALINKIKTANGNELNNNCLDTICNVFKTSKYSFDDLTCCVSYLVSEKRITEKDGTFIVQALCSVNGENEEYLLDDSRDLKTLIKNLYIEINALTKEERTKYFDSVKNDKYELYIYQRAVALIGVHNALLGY